MDVRLWGPHAWEFLHACTYAYPDHPSEEEQQNTKVFFESMAHVLPCERCKMHYGRMLRDMPIDSHLKSREALARWLVEAHNRVNDRTGKPRVEYDYIKTKYDGMRGTCRTEVNPNDVKAACKATSPLVAAGRVFVGGMFLLMFLGILYMVIVKARKKAAAPK